jgi:putative methyltransferase (TIGR04325 family)
MNTRVWVGQFSSYADALASAAERLGLHDGDALALFANEDWLDRQARLTQINRGTRSNGFARPSTLPPISASMNAHRIADFGGGSGWVYRMLLSCGVRGIHDYAVIEIPAVVNRFAHEGDSVLRFVLNDGESLVGMAPGEVDILYSNSALQYLPSNDSFLDLVTRLAPRAVLLDELLWTPADEDWFTVQMNAADPIAARFTSHSRLCRELASLRYETVLSMPYGGMHYEYPDMSNFPHGRRVEYGLTLLFTLR